MAVPSTNPDLVALLTQAVIRACDPLVGRWLESAVEHAAIGGFKSIGAPFAGASRRLRNVDVRITGPETRVLATSGLANTAGLNAAAAARIALLLQACGPLQPAAERETVADLFRTGDNDERFAVLRALPLLPSAALHSDTAREACRTNVLSVFEGIACENSYPMRFFDDEGFNQLVLKALFLEVSVSRIEGLGQRANAELQRMSAAYASERQAAGRIVPRDVDVVANLSRGRA